MLISLHVLVVSWVPYNQARNTLTILRSSENYGTSWDSCLSIPKSTKPHPRTEFLWFRARHECHLRHTSHVKHLQKLQLPTNHQPSDCKAKILHFDFWTLLPRADLIKRIVKQGTSWDSCLRVTKSIKPSLWIQFLWARHECNLLHLTCHQTPTTNRETINSDVLELLWQDSLATGLAKFEAWRACGTGPLEFMVQRRYLTAVYRDARNCLEDQFKPIFGSVSKGCFAACTFKDHSGQNHSKKKWSTWASTKTVAGT